MFGVRFGVTSDPRHQAMRTDTPVCRCFICTRRRMWSAGSRIVGAKEATDTAPTR